MTREEALKILYDLHDKSLFSAITALETLIPELAESEDERIRKEIISALKFANDNGVYDKHLAWLEKQKEQKPTQEELSYEKLVRNAEEEVNVLYPNNEEEGTEAWERRECLREHYMKGAVQAAMESLDIKEQKPVNISENNDSDVNGHLTGKILVEYGKHAKVRDGKRHCEMDWKEFQRLAHYFYELGKAEQKPAEWSYPYGKNETADQLIAIAECLEMDGDCSFNGYKGKDCGKFLRELAIRESENNPAEWSEEDCIKQRALIDTLRGETTCFTTNDFISWIKSLRPQPHWKPSEEQMEILKKSVVGEVHHESDKHRWIDFDKKLLFEEGERVKVIVLENK